MIGFCVAVVVVLLIASWILGIIIKSTMFFTQITHFIILVPIIFLLGFLFVIWCRDENTVD